MSSEWLEVIIAQRCLPRFDEDQGRSTRKCERDIDGPHQEASGIRWAKRQRSMQAAQEEDCSATGTIAALAVFALGFANLLAKAVLAASMASIAYAVRFAILAVSDVCRNC
ncbi:hypothetical protein RlegWSM1455_10050 [Rhizobium laguerreae]|jgi:hypothetical protein|uniref:hypothetical protein n=2 Tax=Rhizobium laguerreae TaxID=1076926 RepID=UPI001C8FDD4F|nr:hypothetical protein [Rhizobium laguerreae]MBY3247512.1 hypothetical protein [Rhizobium laguerreae]UFW66954.1 hypothetical protein RlegWSM1455_10050 [Rhizobium laguerreae]